MRRNSVVRRIHVCPAVLVAVRNLKVVQGNLFQASAGDLLLIRDVLLVGAGGRRVHGSAEVVALLDGLSERVAEALATTDQPIGRLLRDNGVQVTRELRRWGHLPAGRQAARLGEGLTPSSRVPARTYLMRLASGKPLALLTERFAPHVFG